MESRQGLVNTLQTIPVSLFFCHLSTKQREEKTRLDFFFWRKTLIPIAVNGIHQLEEPRGIVWIKNLQLVQIHSLNHSLTHSWGKTKSCVRHNVKKKKKLSWMNLIGSPQSSIIPASLTAPSRETALKLQMETQVCFNIGITVTCNIRLFLQGIILLRQKKLLNNAP